MTRNGSRRLAPGLSTSMRWHFLTIGQGVMTPTIRFARNEMIRKTFLTLQSILKGSVCTVGGRMFGWSNLEEAFPILAEWLHIGLDFDYLADTETMMGLGGSNPCLQMMARAMVGQTDMRAEDYRQMAEWLSKLIEAVRLLHFRQHGKHGRTGQGRGAPASFNPPTTHFVDLDYSECRCEAPPISCLQAMKLATEGRVFF